MIQKPVKCQNHSVEVIFEIDFEDEEIKDRPVFTLTRIHEYNQKNYLLQVTFDRNLNARRVNCFDIQEPEDELRKRAKDAEIQTYLENIKNKAQYTNWGIFKCGSGRFPLVDHIHHLTCNAVTHYKKSEFVEILEKIKFTPMDAPQPSLIKKMVRRQNFRGILLILNPRENIVEFINSAIDNSSDNMCIGICPLDRAGKIDINQFIADLSGNFLSHRKANQSFGFLRLDPTNTKDSVQDVLSWVMGF
ncbi:MAG: hypothetical protein ACFFBD_01140 [Candidatus Hodarchaeota archaeon]